MNTSAIRNVIKHKVYALQDKLQPFMLALISACLAKSVTDDRKLDRISALEIVVMVLHTALGLNLARIAQISGNT